MLYAAGENVCERAGEQSMTKRASASATANTESGMDKSGTPTSFRTSYTILCSDVDWLGSSAMLRRVVHRKCEFVDSSSTLGGVRGLAFGATGHPLNADSFSYPI